MRGSLYSPWAFTSFAKSAAASCAPSLGASIRIPCMFLERRCGKFRCRKMRRADAAISPPINYTLKIATVNQ